MKKTLWTLCMLAGFSASTAWAQATPVGVWKTIDDSTKAEKSQVRISESGGVLTGRIEKLLAPDAKVDAVCEPCTDDRKGKPLVGLEIIRGVKKSAEGCRIRGKQNRLWGKVAMMENLPRDSQKMLEQVNQKILNVRARIRENPDSTLLNDELRRLRKVKLCLLDSGSFTPRIQNLRAR